MARISSVTTNGTPAPPPPVMPDPPRRTAQQTPPRVIEDEPEPESPAQTQAESAEGETKPFFELLRGFTDEDWQKHLVYVYRQEPITDRRAGGNTTVFVVKYTKPFDEQDIMLEQGSGKYQARLNRRYANGKDKTIARHEFLIENPNYPPRIPPAEWVDDPRNDKWAAWMKLAEKKPEGNPLAPGTPLAETFEFVRNIVQQVRPDASQTTQGEMVRAVLDAVKDTRRELAEGSHNWIETVKALSPLLAPVIASLFAKRDDTAADKLLIVMAQQGAEKDRVINELIAAKSSPTSSMKDTLQVMALMRDMFPAPAAASDHSMIGNLMNLAPALLQMFNRPRPPATGPAFPVNLPPPAMPAPAPPPAAAPNGSPAAAPTMENPPVNAQPYTAEQLEYIQQIVMSNARSLLRFLNEGRSGNDYADFFIEGNGMSDYMLMKNFGIENLMIAIQAAPLAWNIIQPIEPQFRQFMSQFYAGPIDSPDEPDDEDDEEPEEDHRPE